MYTHVQERVGVKNVGLYLFTSNSFLQFLYKLVQAQVKQNTICHVWILVFFFRCKRHWKTLFDTTRNQTSPPFQWHIARYVVHTDAQQQLHKHRPKLAAHPAEGVRPRCKSGVPQPTSTKHTTLFWFLGEQWTLRVLVKGWRGRASKTFWGDGILEGILIYKLIQCIYTCPVRVWNNKHIS